MLKIEKVIAIQNYGVSGTTLMHSLLDNHPQIMSLPMLHAEPLYRIWDRIAAEGAMQNREKVTQIFREMIPFLFNVHAGADASLLQMGENKNEAIEVHENIFFENFWKTVPQNFTRKDFITGVYVAYNLCYGNNFNDDAWICYPIHSQDIKVAEYLLQDFAQVHFLHMVREPVQNMGSLIKHINHGQIKASLFKSLLGCAVQQILFEKMYHWSGFILQHGKKPYFKDSSENGRVVESRAVRLEDIHRNPNFTLEKIANWLKISWHENLLKSTFMGKLWHNRVESVRVSGINKQVIAQQHDQYLSNFDKFRLRLLTRSEQKYFGYKNYNLLDRFYFLFLPLLLLFPFRVDFNKKRLQARMEVLRGLHSNEGRSIILDIFFSHLPEKKVQEFFPQKFFAVTEWVVFDIMTNSVPGEYVKMVKTSYDKRQTKLMLLSMPFYFLRVISNYIFLRVLMIMVWRRIVSRGEENKNYIQMLYDLNELKNEQK